MSRAKKAPHDAHVVAVSFHSLVTWENTVGLLQLDIAGERSNEALDALPSGVCAIVLPDLLKR